ncbi:MAG: trypsin-like peptidase domain-containing protein [Burkholderiaceae bacterium]|nr:trypsin-like peptidase domain-containing protein [Ideonella sp.]MCC7284853.1 trypsin-like peptidase domain-containing protein [Burkholderiaceae bacterium]
MKRVPLYSRTPVRTQAPAAGAPAASPEAAPDGEAEDPPGVLARAASRLRGALGRHERWAWAGFALLLAALAGWPSWVRHERQIPTFEQIDTAMRASIAKEPLASAAANAYEAVIGSVVRVVGEHPADRADPKEGEEHTSVGTGVVIVDKGIILTNLHVVSGAERIKVTFHTGLESEATLINVQPENDLAVLQAANRPDELEAATMRSTGGLRPGDEVIAVGFPFGIGPSTSQGVISGLKREFRSPQGKRVLTNLIQFDAAANPGNSGGPLVTMDGHVVGIVTAIMNPTEARTFIGIGFAVPIENAAAAAGLPPF